MALIGLLPCRISANSAGGGGCGVDIHIHIYIYDGGCGFLNSGSGRKLSCPVNWLRGVGVSDSGRATLILSGTE